MLKCPVCGCTDYPNQNTSVNFRCPVIGCDGIIEVNPRPNATRMWKKPQNAFLDWAKQDASSEANRSDK